MSRFVVYVLVPETTGDLVHAVRQLLWPYHVDCRIEIEELEEPCLCVIHGQIENRNCRACNGTGVEKRLWNPNTRHDGYYLGGDWDWNIPLAECLLSPCELKLDGGAAPLRNLDVEKREMPRAVVTPDGRWHEEYD